jgi:hypothetical protein
MSTRFSGLLVVLESDTREDDAQSLIEAISQLRGVAHVRGCATDSEQYTKAQQTRLAIAQELYEFAHGLVKREGP